MTRKEGPTGNLLITGRWRIPPNLCNHAAMDTTSQHPPRTIEAVVDEDGHIRLFEPLEPGHARRALVTILDEAPRQPSHDAARVSEATLSRDWDRPEEDAAWAHLQPAP